MRLQNLLNLFGLGAERGDVGQRTALLHHGTDESLTGASSGPLAASSRLLPRRFAARQSARLKLGRARVTTG